MGTVSSQWGSVFCTIGWVLSLASVVVIGEVSPANSSNVGLKRVGADSHVSKGYEVPIRSPMSMHQLAIQVVPRSHE
jgi:hypothetical protein